MFLFTASWITFRCILELVLGKKFYPVPALDYTQFSMVSVELQSNEAIYVTRELYFEGRL